MGGLGGSEGCWRACACLYAVSACLFAAFACDIVMPLVVVVTAVVLLLIRC